MLKLTDDNYFSKESDKEYMSVSQFKSFLPRYHGCEVKAMAQINGTYKQQDNTALLVGSYVHSHFESTESFEKFKKDNKEIFTQKGILKSQYKQADEMINCLETDENFKQIYVGDKEKIFTFELFGVHWKIKVDCLNLKDGYFIDLKTVRDFENQWIYDEILERKVPMSFVEAWGYIIQIAIYKKGIELATGAKDLDGFIVAVTKQSIPDKEVLYFTENDYEKGLNEVQANMQHVLDVKNGKIKPERCGKCDYCRSTKKLIRAIHYTEL